MDQLAPTGPVGSSAEGGAKPFLPSEAPIQLGQPAPHERGPWDRKRGS